MAGSCRSTPQALEEDARYQVTIKIRRMTPLLTDLNDAWRRSGLTAAEDGADGRFGVRALDKSWKVVRGIYLDRSGTRGYFNGRSGDPFVEFAETVAGEVLREDHRRRVRFHAADSDRTKPSAK